MAEELLRRRLADALDPGADFPTSTLLDRSIAALEREAEPRRRARRAIAVVASAVIIVAALGVLELHVGLRGGIRSASAPPGAVAVFPTLGPGDDAALVVAGPHDAALYISGDRGHKWRRSLELGTHWVGAYFRFFADGSGIVLADRLYVTSDRGAHWLPVSLTGSADSYRACFSQPAEGWLLAVHGSGLGLNEPLYHSSDGGRTWARVAYTDADHGFRYAETAWDLVCWGAGFVGVVTANHDGPPAFHYSADSGLTWQLTELSPPSPPIARSSAAAFVGNAMWSTDGRAVLPVLIGGSTSLYTSTDGGRTWLGPLMAPLQVVMGHGTPPDVGVTDAPGGWWAVADDRVAYSADGGRSWTQHRIPVPSGYAAVTADFATPDRGWVVASDLPAVRPAPPSHSTPPPVHTVVLATEDGGIHWHRIAIPS